MTVRIPLTQGRFAIVDDADEALVGPLKWFAVRHGRTFYARRNVPRPGGVGRTIQRMHDLLTGWDYVDHINGDGLDNRRANLRPATPAQNQANMRKPLTPTSTSRFKGVSWRPDTSRWRARILVNGKKIHLGSFDDEIDAALAYDAAARHASGAYAALNFPGPGERSALELPDGAS